jgi:hypothetical protein
VLRVRRLVSVSSFLTLNWATLWDPETKKIYAALWRVPTRDRCIPGPSFMKKGLQGQGQGQAEILQRLL